ncbi:Gfo/Idh/MocA family oxidoreductase [Candidatus Dojkabacteria bacterium]|jgi:predicted dehydrogenase|nr:Gfo/Idh/MocA family oxidoreductase [Candidatus Dojkabacteria bacterium]
MKVAIIGCGLIGKKRLSAFENDDELVACCDTNYKLALNSNFFLNYKDLIDKINCDVVIVSVVNKYAKEIVEYALNNKKHVLVEKPMGMNYNDSLSMFNTSKNTNKKLYVGFNHRFHPAILKAKELENTIGKKIIIRGTYGHGGRIGMEKEWRCDKKLCGGGELLDQGIHLIDLCRWFAGDIKSVFGKTKTKYWDIEAEDNVFMWLKSKLNVDIHLHASWTNWKNIFQFEIFGTEGYLKINGLGGSYGKEILEYGLKNGGVPDINIFEYDEDDSWKKEWHHFKNIINSKTPDNSIDGLEANKIIKAIYKSSRKNKVIKI